MIIGDLAVANDHVMREHAAHRLVEAAADRLVRDVKRRPGLGPAGVQLFERLLHKVQRASGGVNLEEGACTVAFDGIAPLGNFPLEFDFRLGRRLGQQEFHALPGGLNVADVDFAGQCRGP